MVSDLESANAERSKINQKYAEQYRRAGAASALGTGNSAYESAVKLPSSKATVIGSGMRNYPSARALSNRVEPRHIGASIDSNNPSSRQLAAPYQSGDLTERR